MPHENDPTFGQIAVTLGLATPHQVLESFKIQRTEGRNRPVADILVDRGVLKPADVARIYEVLRITGVDVPRAPGDAATLADEPATELGGTRRKIEPPSEMNVFDALTTPRRKIEPPSDMNVLDALTQPRRRVEPPTSLNLLEVPPLSAATIAREVSEAALTRPAGPAQSLAAPPDLDRFEILGEIGRGGMGVVYRARQKGLNRTVALKLLGGGAAASPDEVERFHREAQSAAKLHHPGIVEVYDVGEIAGRPYIAMEFVDGLPLDQYWKRIGADLRVKVDLLRRVTEAVAHAHAQGIVHRDLKPANVLVDRTGNPRVADFGLAKEVREESESLTRSGAILGTPQYMSPEQADGQSRHIDVRTDVYSLGAMLYEMIAGRRPFEADGAVAVILKLVSDEVVPPRKLVAGIPADLETICLKALEKERERRYDSAADFGADLARFLAGDPIAARPPSWSRLAARRIRRHGTLFTAAVGLILVAASGWLALGWYQDARESQREQDRLAEVARREQAEAKRREEKRGRARALYDRAKLHSDPERAIATLTESLQIDPDWPDPWYERGLRLVAAGRREDAVKDFSHVIDLDARFTYAYYHRAEAYRDLKNLDLARPDYEKVVALDPKSEFGYFAQGCLLWLKDDLAGAIPWFGKVLELNPQQPYAYRNRASCLMATGDFPAAIRDYGKFLELRPGDGDAWTLLGWCHERMSQFPRALECFRKAVALIPKDAQTHCGLGACYTKLGKGDEAVAELDEAIRLDPKYTDPYVRKVELLRAAKRIDAAQELAKQTLEKFPGHPSALDTMGMILLDMNRAQDALALHDQAIAKKGDDAYYYLHRANAYLTLNRLEEAETDLGRALKLNPIFPEAINARAVLRYYRKDYEGALADFGLMAQYLPERPEGFANRGEIYRAQGKYPEALEELGKALERDPDFSVALNSRACAWLALKDEDKAFADLEHCIEKNPYYANPRFNRARLHLKRGHPEKAIEDWEAVLKIDPDNPNNAEVRQEIEKARKLLGDK